MTNKGLGSLVVILSLSAVIHAEDFIIIGDEGNETISRISMNGEPQLLVPPLRNGELETDSFAVHQYNRQLYYGHNQTSISDGHQLLAKSLENPGNTSILHSSPNSELLQQRKVIDPTENVFFVVQGSIREYTLGGIWNWEYSDRIYYRRSNYDYDFDRIYLAAVAPSFSGTGTGTHFVVGSVLGDEVQQLLFSPSFEFDDVAIDATSGIIYAVNEAGGLYSVNPDGTDPAFLGNSGVSPQSEQDFYLDAYNEVMYLGHDDSVYSISIDQVGTPSVLCNNCATSINRIQYVVNDFAKSGDTDLDYDVDLTDFNNLASNFEPSGFLDRIWKDGDFDGNHIVDITDFNLLADNFSPSGYDRQLNLGGNVQAPEPSALLLASLAAILVGVSRRLSKNNCD